MKPAIALQTLLAAMLVLAAGAAQAGKAPAHSDFTGIWTLGSLTELERPKAFKTLVVPDPDAKAYEKLHRNTPPDYATEDDPTHGAEAEWWERDVGLARIRGQARSSWIVSPADGQRPENPAAKAAAKAARLRRKTDFNGPESRTRGERCVDTGAGPPLTNGGANDLYQFILTGDQLVIHAEWLDDVRVARIGDTRHPPPQVRLVGGDSVAHWEGPTLVVETTNFSPADVDDPKHDPNADMRTLERFTRLSDQELLYDVTVTNPAHDTQTWRAEMVFEASRKPMYEFACHEGNYALRSMLAGERRLEGRTVDGFAKGQ